MKRLIKLSDLKIRQGILFKNLAMSIEQNQKDKTLKEWLELTNKLIKAKVEE